MALRPGEILADYEVEAVLGGGDTGAVYRARQLSLERTVALKILSVELAGDAQLQERFRVEAGRAARLDHPNIVPVFELGEAEEMLFLAMRFVDGVTLSDSLVSGDMTPRETLHVLQSIGAALDAAHDVGLVHRDIKPENILISAGGHPYLTDFGIAKRSVATGTTKARGFLGSTGYAAPEQINGDEVTRATDIYALTGLLFRCLSGRAPFEHDTESSLLRAHLEADPPRFEDLGFEVPEALEDLIAHGLAKRAEDRFVTAGSLMDEAEWALSLLPDGALDEVSLPLNPLPDGALDEVPLPLSLPDAWEPVESTEDRPKPRAAGDRVRPRPGAGSVLPSRSFGARPHAFPRAGALVAAAALLCAVAGFVAVGSGGGADEREITIGQLRLQYDASWNAAAASLPGLRLATTEGLVRAEGTSEGKLAAGVVSEPGSGLGPAPKELRARWKERVAPKRVRLGDAEAYAYRAPLKQEGTQLSYFIPTEQHYLAVACETPASDDADFVRACEAVVASASVAGDAARPVGPSAAVAEKLEAAMSKLRSDRRRHARLLNSRSATARARGARMLARSHRSFARGLRSGPVPLQDRAGIERIAASGAALARAFDQMAAMAKRKSYRAYDKARVRLAAADRGLRSAIAGLKALGYALRQPGSRD
jgi:serine/threonine protein kinase